MAPPGAVYFSESTFHAMTKSEVRHEEAGRFTVKGGSGRCCCIARWGSEPGASPPTLRVARPLSFQTALCEERACEVRRTAAEAKRFSYTAQNYACYNDGFNRDGKGIDVKCRLVIYAGHTSAYRTRRRI